MARGTRADYARISDNAGATLASAKNPDGTDYTLPVELSSSVGAFVAATAIEVASGTADAQAVAAQAGLRLLGYSIRESAAAAAAASVIIRHGTSTAGAPLAFVELDLDQSVTVWFGPDGLAAAGGIFIDRTAGETHIVIFYKVI